MAKSTAQGSSQTNATTWVWPSLEPGETELMHKQRILETLKPFVRALARAQAREDIEAARSAKLTE